MLLPLPSRQPACRGVTEVGAAAARRGQPPNLGRLQIAEECHEALILSPRLAGLGV
jgi:hypothetical protein